jgi:hypothetical protein
MHKANASLRVQTGDAVYAIKSGRTKALPYEFRPFIHPYPNRTA